jgi:hypothetical protein
VCCRGWFPCPPQQPCARARDSGPCTCVRSCVRSRVQYQRRSRWLQRPTLLAASLAPRCRAPCLRASLFTPNAVRPPPPPPPRRAAPRRAAPRRAAPQIRTLALSPDGQLLISIDEDGKALVVHRPRRVLLHHLSFKGPVRAARFSPDGAYIAVGVGKLLQVRRPPSFALHYAAWRPAALRRALGHVPPSACAGLRAVAQCRAMLWGGGVRAF